MRLNLLLCFLFGHKWFPYRYRVIGGGQRIEDAHLACDRCHLEPHVLGKFVGDGPELPTSEAWLGGINQLTGTSF